MRVLFIGCVKSSYVLMDELLKNNINIVGVVTKKISRLNSDFADLSPLCNEYNVDIHYTKDARDEETYKFIKNKKPDLIYCFGWSHILSIEIINIPSTLASAFKSSEF